MTVSKKMAKVNIQLQKEKLIKENYGDKSIWTRHCEEDFCTVTPISGKKHGFIPSWVSGTLYRVGPGVLCFGDNCYDGALDGCAIIHAWRIQDGNAQYQSRVLESDAYKTNRAAQRIVVSEFFTIGTPDPCQSAMGLFQTQFLTLPDPKDSSDNCLVNVIKHGDELFVTSETNTIRRIDPVSLETLGPGVRHSDYLSVHNATAHPHTESNGTVFNLGSSIIMGVTHMNIIEFPPPRISENEKYLSSHDQAEILCTLPCSSNVCPAYIHSFGITENYFIIAEHPFGINVPKAIVSKAMNIPVYKFLQFDRNGKVFFRIVHRKTGKELRRTYYADNAFVSFHTINAFETYEGDLVFDLCAGEKPYYELLHFNELAEQDAQVPVTDVVRFVIPVRVENYIAPPTSRHILAGNLVRYIEPGCEAYMDLDGSIRLVGKVMCKTKIEMPRINYNFNGRPYQFVYGVALVDGSRSETCIVKLDLASGQVMKWYKKGSQVFEPVFVANPDGRDEDDGVVLTPVLHLQNIEHVQLLVIDAKTFEELATVDFKANGPVTPTLHGIFNQLDDKVKL